MCQKREKEEALEVKVPAETLTLCPENCKISSNSSTNNTNRSQICVGSSSDPTRMGGSSADAAGPRSENSSGKQAVAADGESRKHAAKKTVNQCWGCGKRVGLTGFRCRCGELFCWEHRYSDRHDCSYDYKAAGREAIARENPAVRAAKILKI
ncbi:hypothetical protein Nepgr_013334 [Nepenthes gracilis]|uniref:AN1-type domain-containing protein n=1 Tax=Nepenthes gracilis TaxID=150966 RepID=A0AAD3SHP0_NEPGR|nr:hypothetical protein Nepgr_013334 [Nepenthes gracilis]